jgi:hypothetical protein
MSRAETRAGAPGPELNASTGALVEVFTGTRYSQARAVAVRPWPPRPAGTGALPASRGPRLRCCRASPEGAPALAQVLRARCTPRSLAGKASKRASAGSPLAAAQSVAMASAPTMSRSSSPAHRARRLTTQPTTAVPPARPPFVAHHGVRCVLLSIPNRCGLLRPRPPFGTESTSRRNLAGAGLRDIAADQHVGTGRRSWPVAQGTLIDFHSLERPPYPVITSETLWRAERCGTRGRYTNPRCSPTRSGPSGLTGGAAGPVRD